MSVLELRCNTLEKAEMNCNLEREELQVAFDEAEAQREDAEGRRITLTQELNQMKTTFTRKLTETEEKVEVNREFMLTFSRSVLMSQL